MNRRSFAVVLTGLIGGGLAGCTSVTTESSAPQQTTDYHDAVEAFNSAVELEEQGSKALTSAMSAWEQAELTTAEHEFNQAMSLYGRAGSRFRETRIDATGCESLGRAADDMVARCLRMERACRSWLEATAKRQAGNSQESRELWETGIMWRDQTTEYPYHGRIDPAHLTC